MVASVGPVALDPLRLITVCLLDFSPFSHRMNVLTEATLSAKSGADAFLKMRYGKTRQTEAFPQQRIILKTISDGRPSSVTRLHRRSPTASAQARISCPHSRDRCRLQTADMGMRMQRGVSVVVVDFVRSTSRLYQHSAVQLLHLPAMPLDWQAPSPTAKRSDTVQARSCCASGVTAGVLTRRAA